MNKKINQKQIIAVFSEIILMITSVIAFSFIIGGMAAFAVPAVSAQSTEDIFSGRCCAEAKDGSICQNMNPSDNGLCKSNLLFTNCNSVEGCQSGCCFNPTDGECSLNSPKDRCEQNGGLWNSDSKCEIAQCTLGCCVIADQASIVTSLQCTKLSEKYGMKKDFQPLDSDGSCSSKTGLAEIGACLTPASDFSGLNECKMTTKEKCKTGEFKVGFLCTDEELKTTCKPSKITSCADGKDEVYFTDTCGNLANIYDAKKFSDKNYWTKLIPAYDSSICKEANSDCGNCDYTQGNICRAYSLGKDSKPTMGNTVCRNLNCVNGRKNGESWCIEDSKSNKDATSPVGSRSFIGKCINGEISIEQCADFNQEICISSKSAGFSEARCLINDWRSCIDSNGKESYDEVERECKKYEQCTMFLDIPGNEKYLDLPGFRKVSNAEQGKAKDVGKDANKVLAYCVPKYTPGMAFWSAETSGNVFGSEISGEKQVSAGNQYGGDYEETKSICAFGSFTCVTRYKRDVSTFDKDPWTAKENPECVLNEDPEKSQLLIDGLNERCRSLGPCGVYVNIAGELGANSADSNFKRTEINQEGKTSSKTTVSENKLSGDYLNSLRSKADVVKAGSMNKLTGAVISYITGMIPVAGFEGVSITTLSPLQAAHPTSALPATPGLGSQIMQIGGTVLTAALAAYSAYEIGKLVGGWTGMGTAQSEALGISLASGVGSGVLASGFGASAGWTLGIGGLAFLVISLFSTASEEKYYITEYSCEPWSPPKTGNCDACNKDIRTCSEYRCRSLGQNCHYFVENGEPGYCSTLGQIWSAKITPWQEALTEGNKYFDVASNQFTIKANDGQKVEAWKQLQFGITTDKPATCKIDTKHTQSYEEMQFEMQSVIPANSVQEAQGNINAYYHKIVLSPYALKNSTSSSTPALVSGEENNYYIRCQNFAGQTNEAEFAVRIMVSEGQDLTPPIIKTFNPKSESYVKYGANSTNLIVWVDEPSECRYSRTTNNLFKDMTGKMNCIINPDSSYLGNWPCYAILEDLKMSENKFFFKCKDQPDIAERMSENRNTNENAKEYTITGCSTGLEITKAEPQNAVVTGKSSASTEINVETKGCIDGGKATCSYSFDGGSYIPFLNTNSIKHLQPLTSLPVGEHNISIKCVDEAENEAYSSIKVSVLLDDSAPKITRAYLLDKNLNIVTDENSICKYTNNKSIKCDFTFESSVSTMEGNEKRHSAPLDLNTNLEYYIRCADSFNNENTGCGIIIKTY